MAEFNLIFQLFITLQYKQNFSTFISKKLEINMTLEENYIVIVLSFSREVYVISREAMMLVESDSERFREIHGRSFHGGACATSSSFCPREDETGG